MKNIRKWISYALNAALWLYCSSLLACPEALPITDPNFCQSFDVAAKCYCVTSGLPLKMCDSTQKVYNRMISVFRSVESACSFQRNTTYQKCVDNWNCYRLGGRNAANEWCSGTGAACI